MNSFRWVAALAFSLLLQFSVAQVPKSNPVVDAARMIGVKGLGNSKSPAKSPTAFQPASSRVYVSAYVKSLFEAEEDRKAIEPALLKLIESYETSTKGTALANDASGAIGYAVAILYAAAKGEQLPEAAFPVLVERLQGYFDTAPIRSASDRQKQEAYEWALCSANLVVALMTEATTEDAKEKIRAMAAAQLEVLLSAKPDQVTLSGKQVAVKGTEASKPAEAPAGNGSLAPGFTFQAPAGWVRRDAWHVYSTNTDTATIAAHVRFPAPIPASGNMGDALRKLWKANVPPELENAAGSMVYRRYVGTKLFSQFIFGLAKEKGRVADSVYTLFLIDCGSVWQPVVVAQTYEPFEAYLSGANFSAKFSYGTTADYAETMLATFRCPGAPNQALATKESLVGEYHFGNTSTQHWENVYTGASSMTFHSSGGTLNLLPDGTFTYKIGFASGEVGRTKFASIKAAGKYVIQGDLLICTYTMYDQGDSYKRKEDRYRIAGLTAFSDGVKVTVLMEDLNIPVNNVSVGHAGKWYSTKKK